MVSVVVSDITRPLALRWIRRCGTLAGDQVLWVAELLRFIITNLVSSPHNVKSWLAGTVGNVEIDAHSNSARLSIANLLAGTALSQCNIHITMVIR